MVQSDQVPRPSARSAHQVIAGEAVLLHLPRFRIAGLNETATFVWRQVDGARTVGQIAGLVAHRYRVSEADALRDVCRFFEKLRERDLIELAAPPGPGR